MGPGIAFDLRQYGNVENESQIGSNQESKENKLQSKLKLKKN